VRRFNRRNVEIGSKGPRRVPILIHGGRSRKREYSSLSAAAVDVL